MKPLSEQELRDDGGMRIFSTFSGIGGFELGIKQAYSGMVNQGGQMDTLPQRQETINSTRIGDTPTKRNQSQSDTTTPTCVGYSEIDKYATSVYERHFKGVKNYGDITKINEKELPDFDCLVGGFPCQAFSIAGKRGGFDDTRGTLFFDLARILLLSISSILYRTFFVLLLILPPFLPAQLLM